VLDRWKTRIQSLKRETYVLYLAYRDPRVPWYAKVIAAAITAYAFSPIDLIPDFIPVVGYLDDLLIVPLGVFLALRLIPPQVLKECRAQADLSMEAGRPVNWIGGAIIASLWVAALAWAALVAYRLIKK